jgi:hypothetical protein
MATARINLNEPRFDQTTYIGRAKHFFNTTNPLNLFATGADLDKAKQLVEQYRYIDSIPLCNVSCELRRGAVNEVNV